MKNTYSTPTINHVLLDHEISLILFSSGGAPGDPDAALFQNELIMNDPILNDGVIGLL
jgi:hypothetical protein